MFIVGVGLVSVLSAASDVLTERTHFTAQRLLLRLVAAFFAANFASVAAQCRGLIGPDGILPLDSTLRELEANLAYRDRKGLATPRSSRAMTQCALGAWRAVGTAHVRAAAYCGCALAVCVASAPVHPWLTPLGFALLYLGWHVYKRALGPFANLQWDMLLLEAGLLCVLLAAASTATASTVAVHLVRSLVVRLHCGAGVAKLTGGDPHWTGLTALAVHHETQPLPTRLARALHALPRRAHRTCTLAGLALEVGTLVACAGAAVPFGAELTFAAVVATQLSIALSGNYGYFNALSACLGFSLLGDGSWPLRWLPPPPSPPASAAAPARLATAAVLAAALPCCALYLARAAAYSEGRCRWFERLAPALRTAEHTFCFASRFSLFTHLTPRRHEIVLEASADGQTWRELECRYKVGDTRRIKRVPPLHMPRLDWRLWLLAQGRPGADWYDALLRRLLAGSADVLALLEPSAAAHGPWVAVRGRRYAYRFGGECWERSPPASGDTHFGQTAWLKTD